ncbi:MAG: hypothetical protein JWP89_5609 [Schlesneria sp.]|nr:hypothetical protein [Schlesneria sp.]
MARERHDPENDESGDSVTRSIVLLVESSAEELDS